VNYSKGITWFDDCRIPFLQDEGYEYKNGPRGNSFSVGQKPDGKRTEPVKSNTNGRFPANLLCSDDVLNDGTISKSGFNPNAKVKQYRGGNFGGGKTNDNGIDYGDKGSNSRYYDIDKWFNKLLDEL